MYRQIKSNERGIVKADKKSGVNDFYNDIELTDEELKAAILEGKKKKFFKLKHEEYWASLEATKGKTKVTGLHENKEVSEVRERIPRK